MQEDFYSWIEELEQTLSRPGGEGGIAWFAGVMAGSLAVRPRMAGLIALLAGVLERNVGWEALLSFKLDIVRRAVSLGAAIHAAVPELSEEQAMRFLYTLHTHTAGLWPSANPSPALEKAIAADEMLSQFHLDFEQELGRFIRTLLTGILDEARRFPNERD